MNTGDWKRRAGLPPLRPPMLRMLEALRVAPAVRITRSTSNACGMYEAADGRLYPPLTVSALRRHGLVRVVRGAGSETVHLEPEEAAQ